MMAEEGDAEANGLPGVPGRTIDQRRATFERNVAHERATGYHKVRLG